MRLAVDHLIIRAADPAATLAELSSRAGAPVLAQVEDVAGMASGIARAGSIDIEVLRIGSEPPERPRGYGVGFTADAPLRDVTVALRELGFPTSVAAKASAGGRSWRAVQVHGLLPDPLKLPTSTKPPGAADKVAEAGAGLLGRIPAVARAASKHAGSSMVAVTEYDFDAAAWRASAGAGPEALEVHLGAAEHLVDWQRLPLDEDSPLRLKADGPAGITKVVLEGERDAFELGDVSFEFRS
jgi:hypothetical protein